MASESCFRTYAESFLGRPINNEKELEDMCITILPFGLTAAQIGYKDKVFISSGVPQSDGSFYFSSHLAQTPGVKDHDIVDTLIYSEPHYIVLARCVGKTMKDWKVMSTGE